MFHLFTHSAFKALLFLAAGACIHSLGYEQDIYRLGGLTKSFTLGYIFILIGGMSLMGLPFYTGYIYLRESISRSNCYSRNH